jgi:hypothetical protein
MRTKLAPNVVLSSHPSRHAPAPAQAGRQTGRAHASDLTDRTRKEGEGFGGRRGDWRFAFVGLELVLSDGTVEANAVGWATGRELAGKGSIESSVSGDRFEKSRFLA